MRIKGAMTVLNKEAEFLGMTFEELLMFMERNPYAVANKALEAWEAYVKHERRIKC